MVLYRKEFSLEKRLSESKRIMEKYDDRIPVIVEKLPSSDIKEMDKRKFLVPKNLSLGQFIFVIRKRVKLAPEMAIFLFIDNTLPPTSELMINLYDKHKGEDNFLSMFYSGENTFGM